MPNRGNATVEPGDLILSPRLKCSTGSVSPPRSMRPASYTEDKELGETNAKKGEKTTEFVMPTSSVDQASAKFAKLKASVSCGIMSSLS